MALTPEQINGFVTKARAAGASDVQIQKEIARKSAQVAEIERATQAAQAGIIPAEAAYQAGVPIEVISAIPKPGTKEQEKTKQQVSSTGNLFKDVKNLYYGEKNTGNTNDDLTTGGGIGGMLGRVGLLLDQTTGGGQKSKLDLGGQKTELTRGERANVYNSTKEAFLSQLKGISGDTGVLSDTDKKDLKKAFPKFNTTPAQAAAQFQILEGMVRSKLKGAGVPDSEIDAVLTGVNQKVQQDENELLFKQLGL